MDLDHYAAEARKHEYEIRDEIQQFGLDRIFDAIAYPSGLKVLVFCAEHRADCLNYLQATPSRRKTLLRKVPGVDKPLFLLSALYLAQLACGMLEQITRTGIQSGPSYRMVTRQAAQAGWAIVNEPPDPWPFFPVDDD